MANNLSLCLKRLSLKLTPLLALSNASRASDLTALGAKFTQTSSEGVVFRIPGLTKTRRSGPPKCFTVLRFEDETLCPVQTLEHYMRRTQPLRSTQNREKDPLLISFRKPHNAVSPATIVRRLKEVYIRSRGGYPELLSTFHKISFSHSSKGLWSIDQRHNECHSYVGAVYPLLRLFTTNLRWLIFLKRY